MKKLQIEINLPSGHKVYYDSIKGDIIKVTSSNDELGNIKTNMIEYSVSGSFLSSQLSNGLFISKEYKDAYVNISNTDILVPYKLFYTKKDAEL
jgi:hypothetical protein